MVLSMDRGKMPNKNYLAGVRFERQVKKDMETNGFIVIRASGSHGPFDLVAVGGNIVDLIQCKVVATEKQIVPLLKKVKRPLPWTAAYNQLLYVKVKGSTLYNIYAL